MSFLNPVSEPVKRFSSTDAGAPQINYASRTAGDVKAVLKACLVTGYGATSSAGWSIVNEVDHVAEFVSPSAAMSDFKLIVDDSIATTTTYKYQPGNTTAVLVSNNNKKDSYITTDYNWYLFATDNAVVFAECARSTSLNKTIARVTYYGLIKSALQVSGIVAWSAGWGSANNRPNTLFKTNFYSNRPLSLNGIAGYEFMTANQTIINNESNKTASLSVIDLWSDVFFTDKKHVIAKQPALLFGLLANDAVAYDVTDSVINNRQAFIVFMGPSESYGPYINYYGFNVAIFTDYWEY